ncbi:MAG TPA: DUF2993 domain-containing protein [Microbacterium sp.]|nr:DUF2993 domain-containing protein [Microbacterium sp.]
MSDEHPTQPLPDPRAQWVLSTDAAAPAPAPTRRRRRAWPWIVAIVIVGLLAVAAWFAGEYIARGIVERTIREQVVSNLNLPADQQIDVTVPGAILPQLIVGSLADVTVASDDVPLNGLTADVVVRAQDVPIRGGDWSGGYATVTLDEAQVQALLASVDGFPAATVVLDEPDVDVTTDLQLFALTVPVGVGLTPSASAGKLVLTPDTLQVAGGEISAEALVDQFGAIARTVVRDWEVCIAEHLPAALTLTGIRVAGQTVVADFEIDSAILHDPAAQQNGTCA